jgi:hypothetical protein
VISLSRIYLLNFDSRVPRYIGKVSDYTQSVRYTLIPSKKYGTNDFNSMDISLYYILKNTVEQLALDTRVRDMRIIVHVLVQQLIK